MKLQRLGINFYKVIVGVAFSLVWARVMYFIWEQPSYLTFVWFYLVVGSILLKWVLFWSIDRIHLAIRLRALKRELDASHQRVKDAETSPPEGNEPYLF